MHLHGRDRRRAVLRLQVGIWSLISMKEYSWFACLSWFKDPTSQQLCKGTGVKLSTKAFLNLKKNPDGICCQVPECIPQSTYTASRTLSQRGQDSKQGQGSGRSHGWFCTCENQTYQASLFLLLFYKPEKISTALLWFCQVHRTKETVHEACLHPFIYPSSNSFLFLLLVATHFRPLILYLDNMYWTLVIV